MAIYTPGPFRLVTVNNAPERAKYVIGRVIDGLKDRYEIEYVGNCDGIDKIGIMTLIQWLWYEAILC